MHHEELLKDTIKASGIPSTKIAKKLKISRKTIYNKFEQEVLPLDFLQSIGEIINYDFTKDIPLINQTINETTSNKAVMNNSSENRVYIPETLSPCEKELFILQRKYIALLEEYNKLLSK